MSKPKDSRPAEGFHQDYIASLRYRNDLPPPDMPPKFLDISHDGLERFLTPAFASNLARREEPNIDVDAEGGMPIDLVGIPGLHLGDESAIMAPEQPPQLDPADLPLLLTLDQLRNPASKNSNVSFLRRTQYISAGSRTTDPLRVTSIRAKPRSQDQAKIFYDDPTYIKRYVQKGFDIAYPESKHTGEDSAARIKGHTPTKAELDAWANPVHPTNPKLKPVGSYPLLPDLDGFPDPGGFVQFKFEKAPVAAVVGKRDKRMELAILLPSAPEERICQEHASKVALHKTNPKLYPDPGPIPWDYDLFLPENQEAIQSVRASLQLSNPDRDDETLYTHTGADGSRFHRFDRMRTYATSSQLLNNDSKQRDIALTLYDRSEISDERKTFLSSRQKGAYYYPILGKTRLKPERVRTLAQAGLAPALPKSKGDQVHQIQVVVRDPNDAELYKRALHRVAIDPKFDENMPPQIPAEDQQMMDEENRESEDVSSRSREPSVGQRAAARAEDEDDRMSE